MSELSVTLAIPVEVHPDAGQVHVIGTNDHPAFQLVGVCRVLGMAGKNAVEQALERLDPVEAIFPDSAGKNQGRGRPRTYDRVYVTEPGLYRIILTSRAENAKAFQNWVFNEVLPSIRRHGCYPPPQQIEDDFHMRQLQAMLDNRRRTLELERRHLALESRVCQIEDRHEAASEMLNGVELAECPAPDKTTRAKLNELVRLWVRSHEANYQETWNKLYKELYYRCHFDAKTRAKNSGKSPLDMVEEEGLTTDLYAIASEILTF